MLRILGSAKSLCDGSTRRDMLQAGGASLLGMGLSDILRLQAKANTAPALKNFGKAKACILLFLYGSPSQLETVDIKPDAPYEVRGDFGHIASSLPELRVGELLPNVSKIMHKVTTVRSLTHPYPLHGVAFATSSVPAIRVEMELSPNDSNHWPFVGSVVDYLLDQQAGGVKPQVPRNIAMPWPMSTRRTGEVSRAGPYAAFLGPAYNPVWTEFHGEGTKSIYKTLRDEKKEIFDPYMGVKPDCRFMLSEAGVLPGDMNLDRLSKRRSLVEQFDRVRRQADGTIAKSNSFDRFHDMAYSLLTSDHVRKALDVSRESNAVRESYGMTLFGQSSLVARRLVEAGSKLVTVFWDEYGLAGSGWDTHWDHYNRMKKELCPGFDQGYYGLIRDLEGRGMLDDTLVVCISEHGRTPKISGAQGGGRDHWSRAYSAMLAGGGVAQGRVVGKTDKIASDVIDCPFSPKDILATIYHLLGIDPNTIFYDRLNRPLVISGEGRVRPEVLA